MQERQADIVIRRIRAEDTSSLVALQKRCEGAAQWSEAAYQDLEATGIKGWATIQAGTYLGFILVRAVADEMEILNLAVDPAARRRRIGCALVGRAIEDARQACVRQIHLEVRESNGAARQFYLSAGFAEYGRRTNYYSQPVEDALRMVLHIQ
jgi:ribosomal-protein-alanine N-acetyltransferase